MASDTPSDYQNLVIYEVYVRNHSPEGTFAGVERDLERIKSLGVDVVWFMPIHPIGKLNKKGSLGCPYSISDYREVNPEYGSKADFKRLVDRIHQLGMQVMIDVVYNHTSHDSVLVHDHPEFFHQDAQGNPVTTVPDWSDVIDLKHPNKALTDYLIDTLKMWAEFGVDGFRCDVASLVPIEFWIQARSEVAKVKPGVIWLAESVHAAFIEYRRTHHLSGLSDSEIYAAFDMTYDYDIWPIFQAAVLGHAPVDRFIEMVRFQKAIYPANYLKMRCSENHDQRRIMGISKSVDHALAWSAFMAFLPGPFLLYGGQESGANHTPSLFDIDKVEWNDYTHQAVYSKITGIKKHKLISTGEWTVKTTQPAVVSLWSSEAASLVGIFNLNHVTGEVVVPVEDGEYIDLISKKQIWVVDGKTAVPANAVVFEYPQAIDLKPFYSELLDWHLPPA
jgi:glycosidase